MIFLLCVFVTHVVRLRKRSHGLLPVPPTMATFSPFSSKNVESIFLFESNKLDVMVGAIDVRKYFKSWKMYLKDLKAKFFGLLSAIAATVFENGFGCVLQLMVMSRAQFHHERTHVRISNLGRLLIFYNCDGIFQVIYSKFNDKPEVIWIVHIAYVTQQTCLPISN